MILVSILNRVLIISYYENLRKFEPIPSVAMTISASTSIIFSVSIMRTKMANWFDPVISATISTSISNEMKKAVNSGTRAPISAAATLNSTKLSSTICKTSALIAVVVFRLAMNLAKKAW